MEVKKFLQWNCRSLNANKNSLIRLLQKHKIDIALISETWINPDKTPPTINNYNIIHTDRGDGKGGSAILIRKTIPFTTLDIKHPLHDLLQITGVKLNILGKECDIVSVYAKPNQKYN